MMSIAIHGGAGLTSPEHLGEEREKSARLDLERSIGEGRKILLAGGSALDAVEAAVQLMEDSPMFNAGHGSVFASDGVQRMDASIMCGATREAGALCGATRIRYPISAARGIMSHTPHVMLSGEDAECFAKDHGLSLVDREYFHTPFRWDQLLRARKTGQIALDHEEIRNKMGTVGAVACDSLGHIAAATSTGGMTNKRPGRVGDSAIIGAGTWADDNTCAVSATGHGELFILQHVAGRLADLMELGGLSLDAAADRVVFEELPLASGGVIAVDRHGQLSLPFNTGGMFRGYWRSNTALHIGVWRGEGLIHVRN